MQNPKNYFYEIIGKLEYNLSRYRNSYPLSVRQIFNNYSRFVVFGIIVVIGGNIFLYTDSEIFIVVGANALYLLIYQMMFTQVIDENKYNYLYKIRRIKAQMSSLLEYPDIKNYMDQFNQELKQTKEAKEDIKTKTRRVLIKGVVVALLFTGINILISQTIIPKNIDNQIFPTYSNGNLKESFLVDNNTFITISPLQNNVWISKGPKLTVTLEEDLHQKVALKIPKPSNEPFKEVNFRLFLTDKNGKRINQCPAFNYNANNPNATTCLILNDIKDPKAYYYEANKLLTYLQTHQDSIFYNIEKIE